MEQIRYRNASSSLNVDTKIISGCFQPLSALIRRVWIFIRQRYWCCMPNASILRCRVAILQFQLCSRILWFVALCALRFGLPSSARRTFWVLPHFTFRGQPATFCHCRFKRKGKHWETIQFHADKATNSRILLVIIPFARSHLARRHLGFFAREIKAQWMQSGWKMTAERNKQV